MKPGRHLGTPRTWDGTLSRAGAACLPPRRIHDDRDGKSNAVIRQLRAELGAGFPIIGVGGILSGQDAVAKIECGADLVQIYTGLIYQGPSLVQQCASSIKNAFSFPPEF